MAKISTSGYKRTSKDKNEPALVIPSNNITMKGVDFPVLGTDNTGYSQMMYPGMEYVFPGNQVFEIPMKQSGGDISIPSLRPTSWLDKYDKGGPGPVNTLNPDNRVYTYKTDPEFFDNQAVYHDNPKASDIIRKKVYSGEWGYNPVTQTLEKLSKDNQVVVSDEIKAMSKDKRNNPSIPFRSEDYKALTYDDLRRVEPLDLSAESTATTGYVQNSQNIVEAFEKRKELKPELTAKEASMPRFGSAIGSYITPEEKQKRAQIDLLYKQYKPENAEQVKQLQLDMINKGFLSNEKTAKGSYKELDGKFGDRTKAAYEKYLNELFRSKSNLDLSSELSRTECGLEGCAEYVSSVTRPNSWVLGDAWTMNDYITSHGGRTKYNIYTNSAFKNVSNEKDLINTTRKVKANNKASAEMFAVGDVVGLFNPNSSYHTTALKEGKGTYNTHVGIVTAIEDGVPIISHNIKGQLHHDKYNDLTIGWISEPPQKKVYVPSSPAETIEDKINVYSKDLTELFAPGMDPTLVAKTVKGILTKETNLGQTRTTNAGLRETVRGVLGESTDPSDISRGIGKLKTSTLPGDIKEFLQISDKEDISDDAGIKGAVYKYIEGYKFFDDYRKKNPKLGLTDEDVHNMAILSYNQGYAKLSNLGYNNPTMTPQEEVAKLRELYNGNVKDITSTNWKYIPEVNIEIAGYPINIDVGQAIYDYKYPEGHPSYIKKVNEYANRKYGGWLQKYQGNEGPSQVKPTSNFTLPSLDPQAQQSADYNKGWEEYNKGVELWRGLLEERERKKGRALTTDEKQKWLQKAVRKTDGRKTEVDPNDPKWDFMFKDSYLTWDPEFGPVRTLNTPVDVTYQLTDLDKEKQKIAAETRKAEMTPFAKSLGMKETDPNVQKRASQNANDQVALRILNDKPQGDRNRVEWLNSLTPEERSTIARSQYAGKLEQDFTSQFSQGLEKNLRNVANIATVGPINWYQGNNAINQPLWTNPDYTQEEAANASAMGILAPLSYPTNLVTGAITGDMDAALQGQRSKPLFTDYRQPEFASAMSGLYEGLYDPMNAVGIGLLEGVDIAGNAARAGKYLNNKYLDIAEGANPFDYAWRSPAARFDNAAIASDEMADVLMPASQKHFDDISSRLNLTDEERKILKEYEYDSRAFTGRGSETIDKNKRAVLDDILKRAEIETSDPLVMSRRINASDPELFKRVGNKIVFDRPTSWSAGRDALGNNVRAERSPDRIVTKLPSGRNKVLKNPYEALTDAQIEEYKQSLRAKGYSENNVETYANMFNTPRVSERELLLGADSQFKQIGKVKNKIGGYDYIVKPIEKPTQLPSSPNAPTAATPGTLSELIGTGFREDPYYHYPAFRRKRYEISQHLNSPEGRARLQKLIDNNPHLQSMNKSVDDLIHDFNSTMFTIEKPVWYENRTIPVDPNNAFNWYINGYDRPSFISVGQNFTPYDAEHILEHEIAHLFQRGTELRGIDDELAKINLKSNPWTRSLWDELYSYNPFGKTADKSYSATNQLYGKDFFSWKNAKDYWKHGAGRGQEKAAFAAEIRENLLQRGLLKNRYDEITPDLLRQHYKLYNNTVGDKYRLRLYDIMKKDKTNFKVLSDVLNQLPVVVPAAIGTGAAAVMSGDGTSQQKYGGWLQKYQDGGDMPFGLPLRSANPGSPWAYESPQASGYLLPDPNRPELLNTGATEYKIGVDDVTIPTVVNGQYMEPDQAYQRYMLTGEKFKPMIDPHSYSAFYNTVGPLGLMKQKKGGPVHKNQYINSVTLSNTSSWLDKYK